MLRLVFTTEQGQLWALELQPGCNRVGRKPDNDFPLEDPSISSHHCEIVLEGDQITVRDLRSTNGTFVDGQPVLGERPVSLRPGQSLQLGQVKMVLEETEVRVAVPQPTTAREDRPAAGDAGLSCLKHPGTPAIWVCTHCGERYCNPCVHHLRRAGGKFLNLCPHCSHPCQLLESARTFIKESGLTRLKRWLGRTVRLRR